MNLARNGFFLQKTKLIICLMMSLLACIAGIAYAVWFGNECDGGRGGALAVAIAFAVLFTSRPTAESLIDSGVSGPLPDFDSADANSRISRLRTALAILIDRQRTESFYLSVSSVTGTLVWGFGDRIAGFLGAAAC